MHKNSRGITVVARVVAVVAVAKAYAMTNVVASYTVLPGDTISGIASCNHTTVKRLCELNNKPSDWWLIHPGETIQIEKPVELHMATVGDGFYQYSVRAGDSLQEIARERRVKVEELCKWNGFKSECVKLGEGQKIRIEKRAWIDWRNPKLKLLYEDYGLPRGNGDDYEVSIDFSAHQVQWSQYTYPDYSGRKLIKRHTHFCDSNCWEIVVKVLQCSKCEDWEGYSVCDSRICDGGARKLTIFDNEREILHAYACNAPLPAGAYLKILKGSRDGSFCVKSTHGDCKNADSTCDGVSQ